jgi:heme exporter protein D
MRSGVEYVVAAYGVMAFALLMYVIAAVMKKARLSREAELVERLERSRELEEPAPSRDLESVDT